MGDLLGLLFFELFARILDDLAKVVGEAITPDSSPRKQVALGCLTLLGLFVVVVFVGYAISLL